MIRYNEIKTTVESTKLEGVVYFYESFGRSDMAHFKVLVNFQKDDVVSQEYVKVGLYDNVFKNKPTLLKNGSHVIAHGYQTTRTFKNKYGQYISYKIIKCTKVELVKEFVGIIPGTENKENCKNNIINLQLRLCFDNPHDIEVKKLPA